MPTKRFMELTTHDDKKVHVNMDYILHIQSDVVGGPNGSKITFADAGRTTLQVKEAPHIIAARGNS